MESLKPVLDALLARYGWGPAAISWLFGLTTISRVVIKPFSLKLQATMTNALADARSDPEDAAWWHDKILSRSWYRLFAFLVDAFTSVKLPTHGDFHRAVNLRPTCS